MRNTNLIRKNYYYFKARISQLNTSNHLPISYAIAIDRILYLFTHAFRTVKISIILAHS